MNELEDAISLHRLIIASLRESIDTAEWLGGKGRYAQILEDHERLRYHTSILAELNAVRLNASCGASLRVH